MGKWVCWSLYFRFQSLTQRRSEYDATLIPQAVQAAFDVERRVFADVTVVGFAIVANVFDDFCAKVRANPQLVRAVRFKAEQAANVRVVAGEGEDSRASKASASR